VAYTPPWPDHPDAAECWGILIAANLGSGRDDAAIEPARHVAIIEPALSDPLDRWGATRSLVENALANDPGSVRGLVDQLTERAVQVGAPSILSETARYRALHALYALDPRDPQLAYTAAHDGVALARNVRDPYAEGLNLSALAFAAVALHRPDADETCRDAISRLYDLRHSQVIWLVIETTAGFFATTGRLHEAAILYGHLDAHHPPWGVPAVRRARQRGLDRVRQLVEFELLMAQGADMDRDELVAYTVERLEHAAALQVELT
jgi:hypothetical protein